MSILQQANQLKCTKVLNPFMRRQICLQCSEKTNTNYNKQPGSSCIMLFLWIHYKIGHYNIFGCDFLNLNQYETRYDNVFKHRKKNSRLRHSDWVGLQISLFTIKYVC